MEKEYDWIDGISLYDSDDKERIAQVKRNEELAYSKHRSAKVRVKNRKKAKSRMSQRERWRRYYHKNRDRLNAKRRLRHATPKGSFQHARATAKARGDEWKLTENQWYRIWEEAPDVYDTERGFYCRPFALRGKSPYKNTQLCRIDTDKPWAFDNVEIRYKLQKLPEDGSEVQDWELITDDK